MPYICQEKSPENQGEPRLELHDTDSAFTCSLGIVGHDLATDVDIALHADVAETSSKILNTVTGLLNAASNADAYIRIRQSDMESALRHSTDLYAMKSSTGDIERCTNELCNFLQKRTSISEHAKRSTILMLMTGASTTQDISTMADAAAKCAPKNCIVNYAVVRPARQNAPISITLLILTDR